MTRTPLILKKYAGRKDSDILMGPTKGVNPPKDLTEGVNLKGRTMARKVIRNHEHCLKKQKQSYIAVGKSNYDKLHART